MSEAPDPERLEQLESNIAEVRDELHDLDPTTDEERSFIDDGASPDEEVDNTIAPPG